MKNLLLVSIFVLAGLGERVEAGISNAFDPFLGRYTVISRMCHETDLPCKHLKELKLEASATLQRAINFKEVSDQRTHQYLLNEFDRTDSYGNKSSAKCEGKGNAFASHSAYTEWSADSGATLEYRALIKIGDLYQYSHRYRLMGNADGHQLNIERHYTLVRKDSLPPGADH